MLTLLASATVLIARGPTRVTAELIDAVPELRAIGRNGIGVDGIDLAAATRRGVAVVIVPDGAVATVAEGTFALLLALAKRLRELDGLVRDGDWDSRDRIVLGDLAGATLGRARADARGATANAGGCQSGGLPVGAACFHHIRSSSCNNAQSWYARPVLRLGSCAPRRAVAYGRVTCVTDP
jgi:hypothetical protein